MNSKRSAMCLVVLLGGCGLLAGCGAPLMDGGAPLASDTVSAPAARRDYLELAKGIVDRRCDDCSGDDDPPPAPSPPTPQCKPDVFANAVAQAWYDTHSMAVDLETVKEFSFSGPPALSFCIEAADYAESVENSIRAALRATDGCRAACRTDPWTQLDDLHNQVEYIKNELRRDCPLAVLPFGGLFVKRLDRQVSAAQTDTGLLVSELASFAACVR